MTGCEGDLGFAVLDTHIRTQLAKAAETLASHADLDTRLNAILEATTDDDQGDSAIAPE